ncbi:hypothetical protein ES332_A06G168400v1 [Gossypium tomentosum]|uniref:Uncharacterized protein n=1 Tax=Gossypium tomentosum TaxID=34277 RepID=A0A5D2Q4R4_GOSTO|nr:hypothetical protein ES332_A06G168400v1 [Gossypium tomentosum]
MVVVCRKKEEIIHKIEGLEDGTLSNLFSKVERWSEKIQVDNKMVWLACQGIPLHVWNCMMFQNIAKKYGEFLGVDIDTRCFKSVVRGNVHVLTKRLTKLMKY